MKYGSLSYYRLYVAAKNLKQCYELSNVFHLSSFPVEEKGQVLEIEDVAIHPQYQLQAYYDIGVIKLKPNKSKLISDVPICPFNARYHVKKLIELRFC